METLANLPIILFESPAILEQWLELNHANPQGIWVKIAKKGSGFTSVTYAEALEAALCYGWIDGQVQKYDDKFYLQKFTPRRPKSTWSKNNVERVARLTADGRMKPSGLAEVEAAKKDGRWDRAYESSKTMTVPEDFQVALDKNPKAKAFFATLNRANTYAFTWRVQTAQKAETRQARINKFIKMLNEGKKLY